MFTVTKIAAAELKKSMAHHDFDDMPLRIAARKQEDGSGVEYQMGFDEPGTGDVMVASSGIDVVIANEHKPLLSGTTLDYVEMEDGKMHFIFLNPNDPTFVPPKDDAQDGAKS